MAGLAQESCVLRFGDFEMDLARRELRRQGVLIALQPQPFQVLALLASTPDRLVARTEIRRVLWPNELAGAFDDRLNFCIRCIRTALDDDPACPKLIKTVRKTGYIFLARVEPIMPAANLAAPSPSISSGVVDSLAPPPPIPRNTENQDKKPVIRRSRTWLAGLAALPGAALVLWFAARSSPAISNRKLAIGDLTPLTHDHQYKTGQIFVAGNSLYFTERRDGVWLLARAPATGGDTSVIPAALADPLLFGTSPDGGILLVGSPMDLSDPEVEAALWLLPSTGGEARPLGAVKARAAAWHPNGRLIAYSHGNGLWVIDPNGGAQRQIASTSGLPDALAWSPDGTWLRFNLNDPRIPGVDPVWEIRSDGSGLHRVLELRRAEQTWSSSAWSRDGRWSFSVEKGENRLYGAWAVPNDGGWRLRQPHAQWIPLFNPDVFAIAGGPVPRGLVLGMWNESSGQLVRWQSQGGFQPYLSGRFVSDLDFSPDGRAVVYVNMADATLWRAEADGSSPVQLTFPPLRAMLPRWSPDGSRIAFNGRAPGRPAKVEVMAAAGGDPRALDADTEPGDEGAPTWSPDGRTIVFGNIHCVQSAGCGIRLLDLATGTARFIPGSEGLRTARLSPDGHYIAALQQPTREIFLFDTRGNAGWKALTGGIFGDNLDWSRNGEFLYADSSDQPNPEIVRIRIADGTRQFIARLFPQGSTESTKAIWFGLDPEERPILCIPVESREIFSASWTSQ